MSKPKQMPSLMNLRCLCGARMLPGFPLATPDNPTNVTVCGTCDRAYRFGVDLDPKPVDVEFLFGEERVQIDRMIKLCRACLGKGPATR